VCGATTHPQYSNKLASNFRLDRALPVARLPAWPGATGSPTQGHNDVQRTEPLVPKTPAPSAGTCRGRQLERIADRAPRTGAFHRARWRRGCQGGDNPGPLPGPHGATCEPSSGKIMATQEAVELARATRAGEAPNANTHDLEAACRGRRQAHRGKVSKPRTMRYWANSLLKLEHKGDQAGIIRTLDRLEGCCQ